MYYDCLLTEMIGCWKYEDAISHSEITDVMLQIMSDGNHGTITQGLSLPFQIPNIIWPLMESDGCRAQQKLAIYWLFFFFFFLFFLF
jgi:hypothetical protein